MNPMKVLAVLTGAMITSAVQADRLDAGRTIDATVARGAYGDVEWAARDLLFTKLASTPAAAGGTPYNLLHRPEWGGEFSGVAALDLTTSEGLFGCSGALLSTGRHVLTAAHCVTDRDGQLTLLGGEAFFPSINTGAFTGAVESVTFSNVVVHPGWTGASFLGGNDLAIITLDAAAPAGVRRYELYTGSDEAGQTHTRVGWGLVGTGNGQPLTINGAGPFSGFRRGTNSYDADGALVEAAFGGPPNPGTLYYDFDDGLFDPDLGYAPHDAFGYWFGIEDSGTGVTEAAAAPGDSGGPIFIDGRLAGVTSFGVTVFDDSTGTVFTSDATDPTFGPDSSFGEFGGDTRVSFYAEWITSQIPEPPAWALLLAGVAAFSARAAGARRGRTSRA
jgi:hypothetical protein